MYITDEAALLLFLHFAQFANDVVESDSFLRRLSSIAQRSVHAVDRLIDTAKRHWLLDKKRRWEMSDSDANIFGISRTVGKHTLIDKMK